MNQMDYTTLMKRTATIQGLFYIVTGLWSLASIGTFQAVTGPKTDLWLVKTVGTFLIVIGGVLLMSAMRKAFSAEVLLLGAGIALALAGVDVIYVVLGRISPVYLLDGIVELVFVGAWSKAYWMRYRAAF